MAKKVILQTIGGKSAGITSVEASSADLDILTGLMEGKCEKYDVKSSGGSSAPVPAFLRAYKISVGKIGANFRDTFKVGHIKASKSSNDITAAIKGVFDASYATDLKCDRASTFSNSVKGA